MSGKIRLDADAKSAVSELLAVAKANKSLESSMENVISVSKESAAEERKLGALRARILRENEDGYDRYKRKLAEAEKALAGLENAEEEIGKARERLRREFLESTELYKASKRAEAEAAQKAAQEERDAANRAADSQRRLAMERKSQIQRDISLIEQSRRAEETAQDRIQREYGETIAAMKRRRVAAEEIARVEARMNAELAETAEVAPKAFDAGAAVRWGGAIATAAGAVTKIYQTLSQIRQEQESFADKQADAAQLRGNLVQLAGPDKARRDQLLQSFEKTFAEGVVRDELEALRLTFELGSAGLLQDREFFSRVGAIDDPVALAKSAGILRAGFGADEVGSASQIVSKLLAAANPAVGVDLGDIAGGVGRVAATAGAAGLSDEEAIAAVARVAEVVGSAEYAGTYVNSLFTSFARKGLTDRLKGQGLNAFLDDIAGLNLNEQGLTEFLGSQEAFRAFSVLRDRQSLGVRLGEINAAQSSGLAEATIANALSDPQIAAAIARRAGVAANQISRDQQSIDTNNALAVQARAEASQRAAGTSELLISVDQTLRTIKRTIEGPAPSAPTALEEQAAKLDAQLELQRQQLAEAKKQTTAIERQRTRVPVSSR